MVRQNSWFFHLNQVKVGVPVQNKSNLSVTNALKCFALLFSIDKVSLSKCEVRNKTAFSRLDIMINPFLLDYQEGFINPSCWLQTGKILSQNIVLTKLDKGSHQKKTGKKVHNSCELWEGGQQILVCEPQKGAFFRANFPKKTCWN